MAEEVLRPIGIVHLMPSPVGRPPRFKKPDELWDKFVEYCDWVDNNPWQLKSGSSAIDDRGKEEKSNFLRQEVRPVQRAYTLYGFCAFAGIHYKWADFRKNYADKLGFKQVIDQIENVVCAQQVDGAMINQFNSGLVARLNGIADKTIQEIVGKDGEDFKWPKLTMEDIEALKAINELK